MLQSRLNGIAENRNGIVFSLVKSHRNDYTLDEAFRPITEESSQHYTD